MLFRPSARKLLPSTALKIDTSHPLAYGLIGAYVPGVSYGMNLVGTGGDLTPSGLYAAAVNSDGPQFNLSSTTFVGAGRLKVTAPSLFKTFTNGASLFWRGRLGVNGNNTQYPMLIGITYDNAGGSPFSVASIHRRGGAASGDYAVQTNSAGTEVIATSTLGLSKDASIGGSFPPGGNAELFHDGVSKATAAMASAPNSTATSILGIGVDLVAVSDDCEFATSAAYIWNRPLSAAEHALLAFDPFCLLMPAEGEMPALFLASATDFAAFSIPQNSLGQINQRIIGY